LNLWIQSIAAVREEGFSEQGVAAFAGIARLISVTVVPRFHWQVLKLSEE